MRQVMGNSVLLCNKTKDDLSNSCNKTKDDFENSCSKTKDD